jgi:TolA-binding protein
MGDAHYYLGIAYYKKNEYRTALYHLEKAQRILQDPAKLEHVEKIIESIGPIHKNQHHPD